MLTFEENGWNFQFLKTLSILNILPIQVDDKKGRIQIQTSNRRGIIWRATYFFVALNWLFTCVRLVQSILQSDQSENEDGFQFRWEHLVIHLMQVVAICMSNSMGFLLLLKNPTEYTIIFNHVFQFQNPLECVNADVNVKEKKKKKTSPTKKQGKFKGNGDTELLEIKGASNDQMGTPKEPEKNENREAEKQVGISTGPEIRPLLIWPLQYSLSELMARLFPFLICLSYALFVLMLAVDPSRPQLLYSALPAKCQNWLNFSILLIFEGIFLGLPVAFAYFTTITQLEFLDQCQLKFHQMEHNLRSLFQKDSGESGEPNLNPNRHQNYHDGNWKVGEISRRNGALRQILKDMKELEVSIEIFNRVFSFCIFSLKITFLGSCILFYFFTIRHHEAHPFMATFTGYVGTVLAAVYCIVYAKAFSVPQNMKRVKTLALLAGSAPSQSQSLSSGLFFWPEFKREVRRIRNVGIKVGSFHQMERMSTPNFISFLISNVVNLLVTFK